MTDSRTAHAHWTARLAPLCGVLTALTLLLPPPAGAQSPVKRDDAPTVSPRIPGSRNFSTELKIQGVQTTSDYIVAVVNQEPVTHTEIDKRVARIQDTAQPGTRLPPTDELRKQVLEALIDEKVQAGYAKAAGMEVNDNEVDAAIENIAGQNQLSLAELKQRMAADGLDYQRYRNTLRDQILLQRVREREVNTRIQISDNELDEFLKTDPAAQNEVALNLAHILIAVPEKANAVQIQALRSKALDVQQRAAQGGNFAQLARENSDDTQTREQGGAFGMRVVSRLPELFVNTAQSLKVGQVSQIVRSAAGFHIVKLIERENSAEATYTQQRARHILLRTTPQLQSADLVERMKKIREQIVTGENSFPQLARQYSEDGSAAKGGDLGWASPGQFVPEFEKALTALQPGQISEPVITRFGVHLIQLIERREVKLTDAQKREAARSVLKERKFESAYEEWARELRAAAWVEMREAP